MSLAHALGAVAPQRVWDTAQLLAIDEDTARAQVSIDGGTPVWLPANLDAVYTGITTVFVIFDPVRGQVVLGPCGVQPAIEVPPTPPDPVETPPPVVTASAVIRPTWSGTYRDLRAAWDRWNVDRYGGRSTLYQGSAYGSGDLHGLAVYGDQVKNLRAESITAMSVSIVMATGSGTVTVQGSASGSKPAGAPSGSGTTASRSGSGSIVLGSTVREAFRTGTTKGLLLAGTDYLAVRGTSHPSGMALSITYTRAG